MEQISQTIQQYEQMMNQLMIEDNFDLRVQAHCSEKQLAYLLKVVNSLYSYGMPSSQSKL